MKKVRDLSAWVIVLLTLVFYTASSLAYMHKSFVSNIRFTELINMLFSRLDRIENKIDSCRGK